MPSIETARHSTDAPTLGRVLAEPKAPPVQETLPPYLRLLYHQSVKGLRNLHEPFPTEWSQVYPPKECSAYFELPFEEYGKGENPWNLVGERMVFDWGDLDKYYNTTAKQGELRRKRMDTVAKVDFSDKARPIIRILVEEKFEDSLRNLNDIFGAMVSAHKKVVGDLDEREDSPSRNNLYVLQVVNPRIGLNPAA